MINNPVRKQLPTLENPGTAIDLRSGKSLIAPDGSVVTGTLPEVEQATPSISVSSGGLITASAVQAGGIVADGTKSATQQLTTQGAETITPGTTAKTAVAAGRYTTGLVQVLGDANLKAANIAEGVSIFGVTGTHKGIERVTGTITFPTKNSYDTLLYTYNAAVQKVKLNGVPSATIDVDSGTTLILFYGYGGTFVQQSAYSYQGLPLATYVSEYNGGSYSTYRLDCFYITQNFTLSCTA